MIRPQADACSTVEGTPVNAIFLPAGQLVSGSPRLAPMVYPSGLHTIPVYPSGLHTISGIRFGNQAEAVEVIPAMPDAPGGQQASIALKPIEPDRQELSASDLVPVVAESCNDHQLVQYEKPITALNCIWGWASNEKSRCAEYDNWAEVWSGNDGSMVKGYHLLAFKLIFGVLGMVLISAFAITDKAWMRDRTLTKEAMAVADSQYLIYLTNWAITVQLGYFIHASIATYVAIQKYNPLDPRPSPCPRWIKICWSTHSLLLSICTATDLLYWILLSSGGTTVVSVFQHAVNGVIQLTDFLVTGHMVPLSHGIYVLIYCIAYVIWSLIFFGTDTRNHWGDNYIYAVLDWRAKPGSAALLSVLCVFLVPIIFGTLFPAISIYRRKAFRNPRHKIA